MDDDAEKEQARQRVIELITNAFDGVAREDGVTLHEAIALDDYAAYDEQAAARALDTEARWQDVPELDIEQGHVVLSFLDPKGFRYYIPAYMLWTLDRYATSASATITSVVFHFELDGLTPDHEYSLSRFELLTVAQSEAVCTFLLFMATYSDEVESANEGLADYWGRFCPG